MLNKQVEEAISNIETKLEKFEPQDALNLIDVIIIKQAFSDMEEIDNKYQEYVNDVIVNSNKLQSKLNKIEEAIDEHTHQFNSIDDYSSMLYDIEQILGDDTNDNADTEL